MATSTTWGGAKYLQDHYDAHVIMSAADWDLVANTPRITEKPRHDLVATLSIRATRRRASAGDKIAHGNVRIYQHRRRPSCRHRRMICPSGLDWSLPELALTSHGARRTGSNTSEFESCHGAWSDSNRREKSEVLTATCAVAVTAHAIAITH